MFDFEYHKKALEISDKWSREVRWSDEDGCWVGSLPEVCGDCCDGKNITDVLKLLDEIAYGYASDILDNPSLKSFLPT